MESQLELSVVIPAYNEELRLPKSLERIRAYLAKRGNSSEVIVVDDGSTDGTAQFVESQMATWPQLRLVKNPGNRGKGYSVRHGIQEARGRIVLFTDADLSAPIEEADKLFNGLSEGGQIEMPIGDSPWGSYFGMFRDKYGIEWMVEFDPKYKG